MKVLLFGEGNTDVTTGATRHRGALAILLARLLEAGGKQCDVSGARLPRLQRGSGYPRKVDLAIGQAQAKGADAVAVVVDRDGHAHRLALLREGREAAQQQAGAPHAALAWRTAVGVAVEMLEAWLIADTAALAELGHVPGAMPYPESIPNPKQRLTALLDEVAADAATAYDRIAHAANISEIERRCPAFREFAREVRSLLLQGDQ